MVFARFALCAGHPWAMPLARWLGMSAPAGSSGQHGVVVLRAFEALLPSVVTTASARSGITAPSRRIRNDPSGPELCHQAGRQRWLKAVPSMFESVTEISATTEVLFPDSGTVQSDARTCWTSGFGSRI